MGRLSRLRAALDERLTPFTGSVRHKLLTLVLAPLLLGVPALLLIVWYWGTQGYNQLLINKVSADLGTARQVFDRMQTTVGDGLTALAASHRLALALERPEDSGLTVLLSETARRQGFDFLLLLDPQGRVRAGARSAGADRSGWAVVRSALDGNGTHGLDVLAPEQLAAIDPALPPRVVIPLVPTRNAASTARVVEDRALTIHAAVPIVGLGGELLGVLEGGVLLNGSQAIVDRINTVVYQEASLPLGSQGTATLFLDDTRIATNVRLFEGERALGTRASAAVYRRVMDEGRVWLGSAFVVDDIYVSGYEPLLDTEGRRIGMLYVGFLEAPLQEALYRAMAGLFLAFLVVSGLGTLADLRFAQSIFRPLERMNRVIATIEAGDETARAGPILSRDELGRLSRAFDQLLDSLAARRLELQRSAEDLDRKVAERTAELECANATLQQASRQLVMSEKLAAIGQLTAGVAHEINNPVAVIQGNLDLLREVLGDAADPVRDEIRLIDEQTRRIQTIIAKLLQFARPGDFAGQAEPIDLNAVVFDCLLLTRHTMGRRRITVETDLASKVLVEISRGELQQVLINLMVNAVQAMPDGGTLTMETRDTLFPEDDEEGVVLSVHDTGHGIAADHLRRVFDPFFTTKKSEGTGLGLSISFAIVQRQGGHITVESQPGVRTTFTVALRRKARFADPPGEAAPPSALFG
ncbi:cache domain-containing protein [Azospirillum soli]|uniref:cache domain-containing protein n=1 Tax=Azospirillum soli TaxID=1304799 RepID=UPI001AE50DD6|nr:cache domain-containing protein [Azospirillum soli]MBP2314582.1 two-component system NtrC family sensor kinase [Azospirillum soli]